MRYMLQFIFIFLVIPFGFAQQVRVNLSVYQTQLEVGVPIQITITSNVKGDFTLDFPPNFKTFPGGSSGMNQSIDYNSGKNESVYFISKTGSFQSSGKFTFRAKLKTRKKTYQSNSVTVLVQKVKNSINNISTSSAKNQVFGAVEIEKKTIYEGQSLLVSNKIYTQYDLQIEAYEPTKFKGYPEIKDLKSSRDLSFTPVKVNGQQYYQTTFEKKILFFSEAGKHEIGPFKMNVAYEKANGFKKHEIISNKEIVEVLALPANAPKDFNGGIGDFKFTRKFDQLDVKQGDVVVMTVEIYGAGNIQSITKPILDLPENVIQYGDPEESEEINYLQNGASGTKVYKFHLQFLEEGKFSIPAMKLSYFNPEDKKYVTLKSEAAEINVEKSHQFENQVFDKSNESNGQAGLPQNGNNEEKSSNLTVILLSVLLPIILGIFLFFYIKRKEKKELEPEPEIVIENDELARIGSILEQANLSLANENFNASYHQLESAIRMMVKNVTEDSKENSNQENVLHQLSELLVTCETARFLQIFEREQLQYIKNQAYSVFKSIS